MNLFDAVYYENTDEIFRNIFDNAENVHLRNEVGNQPIHAAARNGNKRIIDILMKAGANINSPGAQNNHPIHFASVNGSLEVIRYLVEYLDADPTVLNLKKNSPKDLVDPLNPDEKEIFKVFDDWILNKCSFLNLESVHSVNEQQRTSKIFVERKNTPEKKTVSEATLSPLISLSGSSLHRPRILSRDRIIQQPPQRRRTSSLEDITSPTSSLFQQHSIVSESDHDSEEDEEEYNGYWVEIDGRNVFIKEESENEEVDDVPNDSVELILPEKVTPCEDEFNFTLKPGDIGLGILLEESGSWVSRFVFLNLILD